MASEDADAAASHHTRGSRGTELKKQKNGNFTAECVPVPAKLNMACAKKPFLKADRPPPPKFRPLKQIINIERSVNIPPTVPTYWSIESPPSEYPEKKYCDITGLEAPYTDPQTTLRYHNADVYQFIKTLQQQHIQDYLELRKAALDLRS